MAKGPAIDRTAEFIKLRRQIDVVDTDITLVNKRLDESQSMCSFFLICLGNIRRSIMLILYALAASGVAAVEALRAELALAKEEAQASNAASLKAAEDLRAEQAARR